MQLKELPNCKPLKSTIFDHFDFLYVNGSILPCTQVINLMAENSQNLKASNFESAYAKYTQSTSFKNLIHIRLEAKAQGHSMTFKV